MLVSGFADILCHQNILISWCPEVAIVQNGFSEKEIFFIVFHTLHKHKVIQKGCEVWLVWALSLHSRDVMLAALKCY